VLSRFRGPKDTQQVTRQLETGETDVVIGTHRLLSRDVGFHDLGLLIVDEEHRFGVRHKERLKALKLAVDVLTLTATPIPRTLHLSLAGLRDLTLLETPPKDRSPVLTFIEPWDDGLIEEALARELDRGGQVYFVHNRIETIDTIAERGEGPHPLRDREPCGPARAGAHRGRARETQGSQARCRDGPIRPGRGGHSRVHDDRRVRTRRAEREHNDREPCGPARAGAAVPAARARGEESPPRLLLSARARPRRRRGGRAAPRVGASHRSRLRLPDRVARSRAARRRQPARVRAVGPRAGGRVRYLSPLAPGDG